MHYSHTAARIMLITAIIAGAYFLHDFIAVVALAALTVLIFNPLFHTLLGRLRGHAHTATALTVLAAIVIVVIPLTLMIVLSYYQALTFLSDLRSNHLLDSSSITQTIDTTIDAYNTSVANIPGGEAFQLSSQHFAATVQSFLPAAGNATLHVLRQAGGGLLGFFTGAILYIVLLIYFFMHQGPLLAWLRRISPFDDSINERYFSHIGAIGRSMILGTFVVAAAQGILGAAILTIAGVPYPVFWAVFLTLLSIVPLGSGLATIPIAIIQIMLGNVWQGLFIITMHILLITNIDNVLRALLVSKTAQLPSILTFLAIFAGVSFFGPLGVIYGPIIMVIIMTSFQIYDDFSTTGLPLKGKPTRKPKTSPTS